MKISPIILFVYGRPEHTKKTLSALSNNFLANQSDLIIYADASRNNDDMENVNLVRKIIKNVSGFKSVKIIERTENYGLAKNIIEGVSEVIEKYGQAIILEDDIETSPYFLTYMNNALNRYEDEKQVWHISGWNYPINPKGLDDAFFWRAMNCWGWATWQDRWHHYEKNPEHLISTWSKDKIKAFNLDGACNFWGQVTANASGQINTWAVFWYATIFNNHGLCLNPTTPYTKNIGLDGSGENCEDNESIYTSYLSVEVIKTPEIYIENMLALKRIQKFTKTTISKRIISKLKKIKKYIIGRKNEQH